jgi:hypothetical protein
MFICNYGRTGHRIILVKGKVIEHILKEEELLKSVVQ